MKTNINLEQCLPDQNYFLVEYDAIAMWIIEKKNDMKIFPHELKLKTKEN